MSKIKCPDCKGTGKVVLFNIMTDCQTCDAALTTTVIIDDCDPDVNMWPAIERYLVDIIEGRLKALILLIRKSVFRVKLDKEQSWYPIIAEVEPRHKAPVPYKQRAYNIGMPEIWIDSKGTIEVDGERHWILECVKHEVS